MNFLKSFKKVAMEKVAEPPIPGTGMDKLLKGLRGTFGGQPKPPKTTMVTPPPTTPKPLAPVKPLSS
jgi:hypothetical protein